jgi:hypothetical protein
MLLKLVASTAVVMLGSVMTLAMEILLKLATILVTTQSKSKGG